MIARQEAQAKLNEYCETQGSLDEVHTDGSKMNQRVVAVAFISRIVGQPATNRPQKLPYNSTIFDSEATNISLAENYNRHMVPVHHHVVIYSDFMSCLQAI